MGAKSFRELAVWKEAMKLVMCVYAIVDGFPRRELFALSDQLRRAVVSIPSNIAEGFGRATHKEFAHFLSVSRGSLYGVDTQIEIAVALGYMKSDGEVRERMNNVSKMLGALIRRLHSSHQIQGTKHKALSTI